MTHRPLAVACLAALALTACGGQAGTPNSKSTQTPSPTPTKTKLAQAMDTCNIFDEDWADLGDNDRTLTLDGAGEKDAAGAPIAKIVCVLAAVDTPDSVISQMDQTRALDGMQDATWTGFEARWTYHPDDGMNLILTEK